MSPYLIVRDAEKTLQFLTAVFSAERLRVIPRENGGGVAHAEARIDDSVVMMGEMPDAVETNVHVYVEDVERVFDLAKQAGGEVVQELKRDGEGDYRGGISDGNGTIWWLSQQEEYIEQPK
ncbi:MAG: VOC family protein [Nitratireductor sp.]